MSGQFFLDINTTTGAVERKTAISTSGGAADANKIIRTGSDGKIDPTLMAAAGEGSAELITASENLAAGDWINIHEVGGARRVRRALATDATKPVHGYVTAVVSSGANATVYTSGINGVVVTTGFVAADVGKAAFLSAGTSGGSTKTPPNGAGNIIQRVGYIVEVGTTVRVNFEPSQPITL